MSEKQFYLVWNLQRSVPTCQHWSHQTAMQEAERLARQNPGQRFYVVAATHFVERSDLRVVELDPELPF